MAGNSDPGNPHGPDHDAASQPAEDSEWTRVGSKRRGGKRLRKRPQVHAYGLAEAAPAASLRSVAEIEDDYHKFTARWYDSKAYTSLCQIMKNIAPAAGEIDIAVCLGIGTFDPSDGAWEVKQKAFVQLLAFKTMVDEIGTSPGLSCFCPPSMACVIQVHFEIAANHDDPPEKHTSTTIPCFFQEPLFTGSDKDFLHKIGHTVIESPKCFSMVGPKSLFFGIHLYRPIYAKSLENALPAIYVGTSWSTWDEQPSVHVADLHRLEKMHNSHSEALFPTQDWGNTFSNTSHTNQQQKHDDLFYAMFYAPTLRP
ncbi:Sensitivity To Red Light Reduced-like, SRR1 [Paramyrothecium foliicola]|nr:Sensitivity To Red Light Reduced-like, SRR1 [Paramyrothecium foliicola]